MITISTAEAEAFAHANPTIKSFIDIDMTPIDSSMGWACQTLAGQLKSLYSILSVGSVTGDELVLTAKLAIQQGIVPGRMICVVGSQQEMGSTRRQIAESADKNQIPGVNVLCGDLNHKATFFQAQEFAPFDVLFLSHELPIHIIQRWCEPIKDGGWFVVSEVIENRIGDAFLKPEITVGRIGLRRKTK